MVNYDYGNKDEKKTISGKIGPDENLINKRKRCYWFKLGKVSVVENECYLNGI